MPEKELNRIWVLRKVLNPLSTVESDGAAARQAAEDEGEPGIPQRDVAVGRGAGRRSASARNSVSLKRAGSSM